MTSIFIRVCIVVFTLASAITFSAIVYEGDYWLDRLRIDVITSAEAARVDYNNAHQFTPTKTQNESPPQSVSGPPSKPDTSSSASGDTTPSSPPPPVQTKRASPQNMPQKVTKGALQEATPHTDDSPTPPATQPSRRRRSRAKSFLVVFMGHSGSTAFTSELRSHPNITVDQMEPLDHGAEENDTDLALQTARALLDTGIARGKIPGFKIRPYHIRQQPGRWRDLAREYDARIFWQYRENVVKQAVGEYRHRVLNDSSVIEGLRVDQTACEKGSAQRCRFRVEDMGVMHKLMNQFSLNDELVSEAVRSLQRDGQTMIVRYEDYLYERSRTLREAFDFLGVDYSDTEADRKKASPDSLCDMVSNFQQLCDTFVQCQMWRLYFIDEKNDCRCQPSGAEVFQKKYCYRNVWFQG